MTETRCKFDRETGEYLTPDGETCETPKREHCTARRSCGVHLGWGQLTCARCVGRARRDLQQIVDRAALMLPEALMSGVNSEAANLAGPAADYSVFAARQNIAKRWIMDHIEKPTRGWCDDDECTRRHFKTADGDRWHKRGLESALADLIVETDEQHPYSVLSRWAMMLAEDYGLTLPPTLNIGNAAKFLDGLLSKVAQDEEQDFPLLARELRKCRQHLESAMRDSQTPERGAFCPTCRDAKPPKLVRLTREYPHYCEDPECCQIHVASDELDIWRCPRDPEHWWNPQGYANVLRDRSEHSECA